MTEYLNHLFEIDDLSEGIANDSIPIFSGVIELGDNESSPLWVKLNASVEMELWPSPSIKIDVSDNSSPFGNFFYPDNFQIFRLCDGPSTEVLTTRLRIGKTRMIHFMPSRQPFTARQTSSNLNFVNFRIFNFPFLPRHPINFQVAQWKFEIHACENFCELKRKLDIESGYAMSHYGYMYRVDGGCFSVDDTNKNLNVLHHFLSFVRGGRCGVGLAKGYDSDGEVCVWEQWGIYATERWRYLYSWSGHLIDRVQLWEQIFPKFFELKMHEEGDLTGLIHTSLFWYLQSNETKSNLSGIVLSQAALEKLARNVLTDKEWDKENSFSCRLKKALHNAHIPIDIPQSWRKTFDSFGNDGPEVISGIRNGLIHIKMDESFLEKDYHRVYNLSQWYSVLLLLWKFNYRGRCVNRLAQFDDGEDNVISVPWIHDNEK